MKNQRASTKKAKSPTKVKKGTWVCGEVPKNVRLGLNTLITGELAFKRFNSAEKKGLVIGNHCTMDGVHFSLGKREGWRLGIIAISQMQSCSVSLS